MFKVGEKVVCVEPTPSGSLIKGEIYTISIVIEATNSIGVLEAIPKNGKQYFWGWRFRKLDTDFATDVIAEIIKQVKEESLTLAN